MTGKQQVVGPIAIATHVFERVDFDVYFNHLWCVGHWSKAYELVFVGKAGLDAAGARNAIVETCFEQKCSHVLFLDGDHFVPVETLPYLLDTADQAMVSGVVNKKGEDFQQVCWLIDAVKGKDQFFHAELPLDGRVHEVSVCAFGCTLINLEILSKLKKPYFRDTCTDTDDDGTPINIRSDVNLCRAFRDIGEKIYTDTRILVGHKGVSTVIHPQNAQLLNKLKLIEIDMAKLKEGQVGKYYLPGQRK